MNAVLAQGYPFATAKLEPALVDHKDLTVSVRYALNSGPPAKIGDIRVKGLDRVRIPISSIAAWPNSPGNPYSPNEIAKLRENLRSIDIFESVKVRPAAKPG